ncbi:MAG: dockerin type I repeat-containing protein [Clostridia bacterium]|nr:dockerin type I repeat-containing protein [Clostridia bacterium]
MNKLKVGILLLVFTLILSSVCFAKSDIQNIVLSGNDLSWSPYEGASKYRVDIEDGGCITTSANLLDNIAQYADDWRMRTGDYDVGVTALDSSENEISNTYIVQWHYTAAHDPLDKPTGLVWDGLTARWTAVTNAQKYLVYIFEDTNTESKFDIEETHNYHDFSSDSRILVGHSYRFGLFATGEGYPNSDFSGGSASYYVSDPSAEKGDIPNVTLVGNTLSWGQYALTNRFRIELTGYAGVNLTNTYSYDLSNLAEYAGLTSGSYQVKLFAFNSDTGEHLSNDWTGTYNYSASNQQLDTPQNPRWDGKIARWDAVTNADSYILFLFISPNTTSSYTIYPTTNSFDFTNDSRIQEGNTYFFTVKAKGEGYPTSEQSVPSDNLTGDIVLGDLNVSVSSSGVITWDAYEGADDYYYEIGEESDYTYGVRSLDVFEHIPEGTTGNVTVKITAIKNVGGNPVFITNTWQTIINISTKAKGDINGDKVITVEDIRLLIQAYIHPDQIAEADFPIMDMDGDGVISVADIRKLIQLYVKP